MRITILGCGTSSGVPQVGLGWGDCDPYEPRNRRLRVSILVETDTTRILVDTSPDCRQQLLTHDINTIDAVLFTHAHADHCHGIDDLRWLCMAMGAPIDIYSNQNTLNELQARFSYAFDDLKGNYYYKPVLVPHKIGATQQIGDISVIGFEQGHGFSTTLGFRFGDFVYSTDVVELDAQAMAQIAGCKTWVVDALQPKPHPTHSHLANTLDWIDTIKPDQAYLTHMNCYMDYQTLCKTLPANVAPAHDGLIIEMPD